MLYIFGNLKSSIIKVLKSLGAQGNFTISYREEKIIEKYNLEVALKFRDFQELTLEKP